MSKLLFCLLGAALLGVANVPPSAMPAGGQPAAPPQTPAQPATQPTTQPATTQQQTAPTTNAPNPTSPNASNAVTVSLMRSDSKTSAGTASMQQQGSNVNVSIKVPPAEGATTAAIFKGSCTTRTISGPPEQQLTPVNNGSSQTTLPNTSVSQLASTPHVIIIKASSTTLCGDVSTISQPPKP